MKKEIPARTSATRLIVLGVAITTLLSGCASTGMTGADWGKCIGAIAIGAGAGAAIKGERGAYIGAAAGIAACFAINAQSRRTRTAAEVEADYQQRNAQLPATPEVIAYSTTVPTGSVRRGEPLKIVSSIEAVSGRTQPINEVKEEIRLYEPGNPQPFKTAAKVASESKGSGSYENTYTIKFPENMPQGRYNVRTQLYVNGQPVDQGDNGIQVVFNGVDLLPAAATVASR